MSDSIYTTVKHIEMHASAAKNGAEDAMVNYIAFERFDMTNVYVVFPGEYNYNIFMKKARKSHLTIPHARCLVLRRGTIIGLKFKPNALFFVPCVSRSDALGSYFEELIALIGCMEPTNRIHFISPCPYSAVRYPKVTSLPYDGSPSLQMNVVEFFRHLMLNTD